MADMTRRRASSGSGGQVATESKKRKFDITEEAYSDEESSSDYPCPYCSSVFVTQISLNRHVLTFHDGQTHAVPKVEVNDNEGEFGADMESLEEPVNFYQDGEGEDGYFDGANGEEYYYGEQDEEETNNGEVEVAGVSYYKPSASDQVGSNNQAGLRSSPSRTCKNSSRNAQSKPQVSSEDLDQVLAQVEEITSNTTSDFVTCPLCRKTFGRKELPIHVACEHGGAKFTCPYCGR